MTLQSKEFKAIIRTGNSVKVTGKYILLPHGDKSAMCNVLPEEQLRTFVEGTKIEKITSCGHNAEYGLISSY